MTKFIFKAAILCMAAFTNWDLNLIHCDSNQNYTKGSLHERKKTEIVWSFTKLGEGEVPPDQTISVFFQLFFLLLKNDQNALKHEINQ